MTPGLATPPGRGGRSSCRCCRAVGVAPERLARTEPEVPVERVGGAKASPVPVSRLTRRYPALHPAWRRTASPRGRPGPPRRGRERGRAASPGGQRRGGARGARPPPVLRDVGGRSPPRRRSPAARSRSGHLEPGRPGDAPKLGHGRPPPATRVDTTQQPDRRLHRFRLPTGEISPSGWPRLRERTRRGCGPRSRRSPTGASPTICTLCKTQPTSPTICTLCKTQPTSPTICTLCKTQPTSPTICTLCKT
jgi:hypothetical protein